MKLDIAPSADGCDRWMIVVGNGIVWAWSAPRWMSWRSQRDHVAWWKGNVRRDGRPSKTSADRGTLSLDAAEKITGISNQQTSKPASLTRCKASMTDFSAAWRRSQIATGERVLELRQVGHRWGDIADMLRLAGIDDARRAAALFLAADLASRQPAQGGAGERLVRE